MLANQAMRRKSFRRLRESPYREPVVEGAARNALRAGPGGKLGDGAYRRYEVDCREHYMDKLSGKTL